MTIDWVLLFEFLLVALDKCFPEQGPEERAAAMRSMGRGRLWFAIRNGIKTQWRGESFTWGQLRRATREATEQMHCDLQCASDLELMQFCEESVGASNRSSGDDDVVPAAA